MCIYMCVCVCIYIYIYMKGKCVLVSSGNIRMTRISNREQLRKKSSTI